MSTINGEKDSLLGQTVLPPELGQFFGGLGFFLTPFIFKSFKSLVLDLPEIRQCQQPDCFVRLLVRRCWSDSQLRLVFRVRPGVQPERGREVHRGWRRFLRARRGPGLHPK